MQGDELKVLKRSFISSSRRKYFLENRKYHSAKNIRAEAIGTYMLPCDEREYLLSCFFKLEAPPKGRTAKNSFLNSFSYSPPR